MKVSFVIPAHNEAHQIGRTLASIDAAARAALAPKGVTHDVTVVDDDSTDATGEIAKQGGAEVVRVKLRKIGMVRNAGAARATGDVFIFVDADTEIDADLLRATLRALDRGVIGGGALGKWREAAPFWGRFVLWQWNVISRLMKLASGAYFFARAEHFRAVGGFNEAYFCAEEVALSRALKERGRFVVLPRRYLTSARKVNTHSFREGIRIWWRLVAGGEEGFKKREGKELWYERRDEPGKG